MRSYGSSWALASSAPHGALKLHCRQQKASATLTTATAPAAARAHVVISHEFPTDLHSISMSTG
tara:strand:+ start:1421 stop:1612 length:192 start_codon:yes stop_codon:yes gene_type:complete